MRIAVVTRTRNRPALLARARASVCLQVHRPLVWSVVEDGVSDPEVLKQVEAARGAGIETVLTRLDVSRGRAGAANVGVAACDSDAVMLLDDDDELLPDGVGILARALSAAPTADMGVCAPVEVAEEERQKDGTWTVGRRTLTNVERGPVRLIDLAYRNFVPVNGFLYWRAAWQAVGGYDESLPVLEDWDFVLKLILRGEIGKVHETVARYYVRPKMASPEDPVSNSVVGSHALHEEYEVRLRNRYLRADLEAGRFGLGVLMNPPHRLPMERINALANGMNRAAERHWIVRRLLGSLRR